MLVWCLVHLIGEFLLLEASLGQNICCQPILFALHLLPIPCVILTGVHLPGVCYHSEPVAHCFQWGQSSSLVGHIYYFWKACYTARTVILAVLGTVRIGPLDISILNHTQPLRLSLSFLFSLYIHSTNTLLVQISSGEPGISSASTI